jgi:hypothetical protein
MKSITVLSSAGATIGASPKVIRVDPGEVWRIPRTMGLGAAWEVITAGKRAPQSENSER